MTDLPGLPMFGQQVLVSMGTAAVSHRLKNIVEVLCEVVEIIPPVNARSQPRVRVRPVGGQGSAVVMPRQVKIVEGDA